MPVGSTGPHDKCAQQKWVSPHNHSRQRFSLTLTQVQISVLTAAVCRGDSGDGLLALVPGSSIHHERVSVRIRLSTVSPPPVPLVRHDRSSSRVLEDACEIWFSQTLIGRKVHGIRHTCPGRSQWLEPSRPGFRLARSVCSPVESVAANSRCFGK